MLRKVFWMRFFMSAGGVGHVKFNLLFASAAVQCLSITRNWRRFFFLNKNKKKGEENGPRNVFNQPAGHPVGTRTDDDDDTGPSLSVAP